MASSSSKGGFIEFGFGFGARIAELRLSSAAEVKEFIAGYSKKRCYSKVIREKLEAAALTQLSRLRSISAFRVCAFQSKEAEGRLYKLVKALAPPPLKRASNSNAYANFHAKHPEVVLPKELDFLLKSVLEDRSWAQMTYEIPLDETQERMLERALQRKLIPEWLIRPCSFLTFEENLDIRVQALRLWVAGSKLPVFVGSSLTFEDLRNTDGNAEKPKGFPLEEDLPSTFLVQMREVVVQAIYFGKSVIYPRAGEMPDDCTAHFRCYGNIGYPVSAYGTPIYDKGKYEGGLSYPRGTSDPEWNAEEYEDSVERDLNDFRLNETPSMCKLLSKLLFQ